MFKIQSILLSADRICDQTDQEILELEKKQRDTNREFNNLTRELMFTKNPVDLRILSDKILGLRVMSLFVGFNKFI